MNEESGEIRFDGEFVFDEPVEFEGQSYASVKYDLTGLKGADVVAARYEAGKIRGAGKLAPSLIEDDILHAALVAISADMPAGFINKLNASDFMAWAMVGQLFLAQGLLKVTKI